MATIHERFRNDTAPRLLARFTNGGVSQRVRSVVPNDDPSLPPSVSSSDVAFNAVVVGVSAAVAAASPNLFMSDLKVICAAVDFVPVEGAFVEINGVQRAILQVNPIIASGIPAAYIFYVR